MAEIEVSPERNGKLFALSVHVFWSSMCQYKRDLYWHMLDYTQIGRGCVIALGVRIQPQLHSCDPLRGYALVQRTAVSTLVL